ncbi:TfuA domain-containing protein [Streptomyces sp. NPDC005302]|uniref:TfuA domain-containing protein n=1 Tax=Streptomyces sp. NPDC005302 TaxID=3154675 RepID=UPI00339EDE9C
MSEHSLSFDHTSWEGRLMIHVYCGPTLGPDDPVLAHPAVRWLAPARHGDFFDPVIADTDTVVLVDGVYHQAPAVRHKELLALMARGVRVIGAASIGALRAAELHQFGVEGVGAVFELYRSGRLTADDEVAVGQDPVDGRALTWPLVNLRHVLGLAAAAGVLPPGPRPVDRLLDELRGVYYAQRTPAAVRAVCRRAGAGPFVEWLDEQRAADARFGDVKYSDAVAAVRVALEGGGRGEEAVPAVWDTGYFRRWRGHFATQVVDGVAMPTRLRVVYQQVFDPGFAAVWRVYLERCSLFPPDGGARMPLSQRTRDLTGTADGSLLHAVVRVDPDRCDGSALNVLLARESVADRTAVVRYAAAIERARRAVPGFTVEGVRDDVVMRMLTEVWRCDGAGLGEQARLRGLQTAGRAVEQAKVLVAGFMEDQRRMEGGLVRG